MTEVKEGGIDVKIAGTDLTAFIKRAELARDRADQRPERFAGRREGRCPRHPVRPQGPQGPVSIKALEIAEEKEAIAQYGSSDSGASLGDILGAALKRAGEDRQKGRRVIRSYLERRVASARGFAFWPSCGPYRHPSGEGEPTSQCPLDADGIVDRRRMRRKLMFWRVVGHRRASP